MRADILPTLADVQSAVTALRARRLSWLRRFRDEDVESWFDWDRLRTYALWQELLVVELIGRTGRRSELMGALGQLSQALHEETQTGKHIPAEFRNIIIHSLPTQKEIQLMVQLFESESKQLWHRRKDEPRTCLALDSRINAVLVALGIPDAGQRYDRLLETLVLDIERG